MSDETPSNKTSSIPPPGQSKTAAVPLKKETVRITLRARPGAGVTQPREATAPISPATAGVPRKTTAQVNLPAAPLPPASSKAPTNPVKLPPAPIPPPGRKTMNVTPAPTAGVPAPSLPAPAAAPRPPAPGGAPRPAAPAVAGGAPRPPAPGAPRPPTPGAAPAPKVETGAATQPLTAAPRPPMAGPRPPAAGATAPMAAGSTANLPKATQKIGAAPAPMSRPAIAAPQSAPVKRAAMADSQQFYEEKDPDAGLMPLSIVCFLFAAVLLGVQILSTDKLTFSPEGEDSPYKVPAASPAKWEERNDETGEYTSKWRSALPTIPE
ncbi:MAG: hypothetical protein JNJ83_01960 [Verrucomicrobiaceae bacterium]|nr:hypothetical protein [Verrucomicrobiaceae bacterium]